MTERTLCLWLFLCAILTGALISCKTIPDIPDVPPIIPDTTTTTIPPVPPVSGDVDLSGYEVMGRFDPRQAKTTVKATAARIGAVGGDGGPFAIITLDKPLTWESTDGHCCGTVFIVWGKKTAYFDYVPNGMQEHGWRTQHIVDGCAEFGVTPPASGEAVGFTVMNGNASERSNVAWTIWP